jgi:hypothetical protein
VLVFILLVAEAPGGWGQGQGEGEEERRESGGGLLLSSLVTSCGLGDQSRTLGVCASLFLALLLHFEFFWN